MRLTLFALVMPTLRLLFVFYLPVRHDSHDTSRTNSRVLFARDVTLLAHYIVVLYRLSDYRYAFPFVSM